MGVSECSVGVPPAKSGSFGHKTIVLHRRDARATLFCRCLQILDFGCSVAESPEPDLDLARANLRLIHAHLQPTIAPTGIGNRERGRSWDTSSPSSA